MLVLGFPLFALLCAGVVMLAPRREAALAAYRIALALSAAPFLFHLFATRRSIESWGDPQPPVGDYPGLQAFTVAGVLLAATLLLIARALTARRPVLAALMPATLGLLYWRGVLPLLRWRAPEVVPLDGTPLLWLAAFGVFATACLLVTAWLMKRRMRQSDDGLRGE